MSKESHDDKEEGGGCSEMGGSPTGVDGLETVCRRLPFNNDSDTTERKQCHSLLDWLILRCNYQWQFMNLAGTPVTRAVLVEEVLKIMNAVKDDVTVDDIVEELEKRGIVCDCHMNFVRDIHACALDVRDDDQCTMEELQRKLLFPLNVELRQRMMIMEWIVMSLVALRRMMIIGQSMNLVLLLCSSLMKLQSMVIQSQSVPSLLKIHFYHLSWPT